MLKNKLIVGGLLALCVFLSACTKGEAEKPQLPNTLLVPQQANYKTEEVKISDFVITQKDAVSVVFPAQTKVIWENGTTRFVEALVKRGTMVKKGDVLMHFATEMDVVAMEELQLQLKRTTEAYKSDKAVKDAELENAKNAAEGLTSHELTIAEQKIEKLQVAYEQFVYQSEKNIAAIQERIYEIEKQVATKTLVAPCDGMVYDVAKLSADDEVNNGDLLVTIYDVSELFLRAVDVPYKLRYNMDVTIVVTTPDGSMEFDGHVISAPSILPYDIPQNVVQLDVDTSVLSEEEYKAAVTALGGWELGYTCKAIELSDVMVISAKATHADDGGTFVNVLEDDIVRKRYISIGMHSEGMVCVIDGLSEGQTLILD